MQSIKFIIESNSNKKLDAFTREVINCIKQTGAVKVGPIPSKGKRLVFCYNYNTKTLDRLMAIRCDKKVFVTIL
jgi:ribosomal protein S10